MQDWQLTCHFKKCTSFSTQSKSVLKWLPLLGCCCCCDLPLWPGSRTHRLHLVHSWVVNNQCPWCLSPVANSVAFLLASLFPSSLAADLPTLFSPKNHDVAHVPTTSSVYSSVCPWVPAPVANGQRKRKNIKKERISNIKGFVTLNLDRVTWQNYGFFAPLPFRLLADLPLTLDDLPPLNNMV